MNLHRLAIALEEHTEFEFDMCKVLPNANAGIVGETTYCGTVGCIAGFAVAFFKDEMEQSASHWDAAADWLGFTTVEAERLFLGQFRPADTSFEDVTREQAVAELHRLIHKHYFDRAYNGLEMQAWEKSINQPTSPQCLYHDPRYGRRCVVGHMIDPTDYRAEMDANIWGLTDFQHHDLLIGLTEDQFGAIQGLHDLATSPEDMKQRFDDYRKEHNL